MSKPDIDALVWRMEKEELKMGKSVIHPGVYLREDYLPFKYQGDLHEMLESLSNDSGIDILELNKIIQENFPIDKNISSKLGKIFEIHKKCFYNLQKKYEKNLSKSIQVADCQAMSKKNVKMSPMSL